MTNLNDHGFDFATTDNGSAVGFEANETKTANTTALRLDHWSLRKGAELAEDQGIGSDVEMADFRAAAFEPSPELAEDCSDPKRREFVEELLNTPEWAALRSHTIYDDYASELAALRAYGQFAELKEGDDDSEFAAMKAAAKATRDAAKEVKEYSDAATAIRGLGGSGSGADGKMDPKSTAAIFNRIKSDRQLRRICELAGAYRRLAQSKQRQKVNHGRDDVVGVTQDNDLARLVPAELAMLADDDIELLALRRLLERQTICREYSGVEPKGKGPIVVVVDESGSMNGEPVSNAKAYALAMAWIAKSQNRWCTLIGYSGGCGGNILVLKPGEWDEAKLVDWLEHFYSDGSSMDLPIEEMPRYWKQIDAPKGRTDLIFITDALLKLSSSLEQRFLKWKEEASVKVTSIITMPDAGDLGRISDTVHTISSFTIEQDCVSETLGSV